MSEQDRLLTRRSFIKTSAGSAALLGMPELLSSVEHVQRPPNFIIIYADDLGYGDLGCYGSELISTPRLDRMAREGMKFTSFYSAAPVCTPSRAALMTGCYPMRVSLPHVINSGARIGINSSEITIAEMLKARGYKTCCIGKWHLGYQKPFLPTRHGFDSYFGLPYSNDMSVPNFPVPLIRDEEIIEQPVVQETLTERYTQEAIRFITGNKDRPFFLYLPHTFPHVPLHVSERFRGRSKRGLYGDVVECIDWSTGEILDTLARLGIDEQTLVVFSSDNGPWAAQKENGGSAGPLRGAKGSTWEGGMREPCIMRWPGHIPAGSICGEMAITFDLFPTFARLAGGRVPDDRIIDGRDIWPLMSGQPGARTPHDVFFYYMGQNLLAVRAGRWKLQLERDGPRVGTVSSAELYDLETDIGEKVNLAKKYPKLVRSMRKLADQCREDLGDGLVGKIGKNCRPAGTCDYTGRL